LLFEVLSLAMAIYVSSSAWYGSLCVASVCWFWAMYSLATGNYIFLALAVAAFTANLSVRK